MFSPEVKRRSMQLRRFLQILVAVFSLVPIVAGLDGMLFGSAMLETHGSTNITMDSHFRYLSGLLLGIGLAFLSCIPQIELKTPRFQLLVSIVVLGGIGRLYSLITVGTPSNGMLFGLGMELLITPLLGLFQLSVAHQQKQLQSTI
jgi:hypothetical protein